MIIEFFAPVARNCTQPFASLFSSTFQNLRTHTTLTGHIAIRQTASATMKPHPLVLLFSALASKHVLSYRRQQRDEKRCSRPHSFRPNTLQNKRSEKNLGLPNTWKNPPSINQPGVGFPFNHAFHALLFMIYGFANAQYCRPGSAIRYDVYLQCGRNILTQQAPQSSPLANETHATRVNEAPIRNTRK